MIGYYNSSVLLTYFSVIVSVYGTFYVLKGDFMVALLCLMVCGLCDMFDGMIASKVKRSDEAKKFGIQIDSLCDLLNFGVFPAVIGFGLGLRNFWPITCMVLFILAAVIRLGYFNVDEDIRQQSTSEKRAYYRGLPVTSVAMIIPIFFLLNKFVLKMSIITYYPLLLLILGFMFLLDFRVKKPKSRGMYIIAFIGLIVFTLILFVGKMIAQ